jgi:hypothetical protein
VLLVCGLGPERCEVACGSELGMPPLDSRLAAQRRLDPESALDNGSSTAEPVEPILADVSSDARSSASPPGNHLPDGQAQALRDSLEHPFDQARLV